jgi:hypothetical protein
VIRVAGALLLAAALLGPSTARANELEDFELALNAYESQNYPAAVQRFEALVGGPVPRLQTRLYVLESRKYLGAAYLFVGRRNDAEAQFEALLRDDPTYELDPIAFSTEVLDVFTSVRSRIRQQLQAELEARQRAEAEAAARLAALRLRQQEQLQALLDFAATSTIERNNSRWIAMLPFGIGQFQNENDTLGLVLLIAQGALGVTAITSYLIHQYIAGQDVADPDFPTANLQMEIARYTNIISAIGFYASVAIGIVDAQIRFRPVIRSTRSRPIPPELQRGIQVSLTPSGAALRLAF